VKQDVMTSASPILSIPFALANHFLHPGLKHFANSMPRYSDAHLSSHNPLPHHVLSATGPAMEDDGRAGIPERTSQIGGK
jgi:hypothetical protein